MIGDDNSMTNKIELKNVDEIFGEFLSKDEIVTADAEADAEMKVLKALSTNDF